MTLKFITKIAHRQSTEYPMTTAYSFTKTMLYWEPLGTL